jgi:hypothetical protein
MIPCAILVPISRKVLEVIQGFGEDRAQFSVDYSEQSQNLKISEASGMCGSTTLTFG